MRQQHHSALHKPSAWSILSQSKGAPGAVWPYVVLAVVCGMLFFWRLGATPLMGLDEGLYAECSREMLASGDYVVPTCNGGPFFDKPPLAYWLQSASMRVFGVNSFAVRLPSAIEELLLIALTVFLGTRLFGRRTGLLSGFALATCLLTVGLARMAILDAAFALCITASLGAFLLAYIKLAPKYAYFASWAAMGLSALVKGPAGPVVILATVILFLLVRRDLRAVRGTLPILGTLLALAIALPWYVLVEQRTGGAFLREFIIHQNVKRALGQDFQHNMPFFAYLPIWLVGFFPWSIFVPAALMQSRNHALRQAQEGKARNGDNAASMFMVVWIAVILVVFSIFKSKLPAYIFPIYPASALLVGLLWSRALEAGEFVSLRRGAIAAAVVACLIGAAMLIAPSHLHEPIPGLETALIPMGICLVAGCLACWLLLAHRRPIASFIALCCGMGGFLVFAVWLGLPIAARPAAQPIVEIAQRISHRTDPAFSYNLSPRQPQAGFYSGRPVPILKTPEDLLKTIKEHPNCLIVVQPGRDQGVPSGGKIEAQAEPYVLLRFFPSK